MGAKDQQQQNSDGDDSGDGQGGDGASGGNTEPTGISQEELQRVATKEHKAGQAKAARDLAEKLGMPLDEVENLVKQHREQEEQNRSDIDKATEQARAEKDRAEKLERELRQERLRGQLQTSLLVSTDDAPGCDPAALPTVIDVALGLAESAPDGETDPVAYATAELRKRLPQVFTAGASSAAGGAPPASTPPAGGRTHGQQSNRRDKPLSGVALGRKLAQQYREQSGGGEGGALWQASDS